MKEPQAPTLEELLAELEAATPKKAGGKTVDEWAEAWKVSAPKARKLIRLAILSGRMVTRPELRPDISRPGRRVQVWPHSFVPKNK
jgi:hypothetical protein